MQYQAHMAALEDAKQGHVPLAPTGAGQRWGSGKLEIQDVELCGADGEPKSVFFTNDEMHIRLRYYSRQRVENPIFGLAIHHQNGINLFGPNTKFGGVDIPYVEGSGVIVYTIDRLPLLEGGYSVSVAAINDSDTETFDFHDRAYHFQVYPDSRSGVYGVVNLGGSWRMHETVPAQTDRAVRTIAG